MKKKLVVLTGAGVSAESGLKHSGTVTACGKGYDINQVANPRGWKKDPGLVLDFYNMRRRNVLDAKPNEAHNVLAQLEKDFDVYIVTQNIDDLHERAGSTHVLHLHGEIFKMRSEFDESLVYEITYDIKLGDEAADGAQLRPDIVWFEEPVPRIVEAIRLVSAADIFVIIGTSLAVYPAAGLVNYAGQEIPKFIIDKNIPDTGGIRNIVSIAKPATAGFFELKTLLISIFSSHTRKFATH